MSGPSSSSAGGGGGGKGSNPCPICLEPKQQEAYLDHCFHSFCYGCITRWSSVVGAKKSQPLSSIECPLCKTENFSIVHGFNGEFFQRHYVNPSHGKSCVSSAHEFRLQCYSKSSGITNKACNVQQYWKCRRYLQKNIWLESWLRREIQVLTQEEDVEIILHHIHGAVDSFFGRLRRDGVKGKLDGKREQFRGLLYDAARPFLLGQAECFVDQVELFLASGLNIDAYDRACVKASGIRAYVLTREEAEESCNRRDLHHCYLDEDIDN